MIWVSPVQLILDYLRPSTTLPTCSAMFSILFNRIPCTWLLQGLDIHNYSLLRTSEFSWDSSWCSVWDKWWISWRQRNAGLHRSRGGSQLFDIVSESCTTYTPITTTVSLAALSRKVVRSLAVHCACLVTSHESRYFTVVQDIAQTLDSTKRISFSSRVQNSDLYAYDTLCIARVEREYDCTKTVMRHALMKWLVYR